MFMAGKAHYMVMRVNLDCNSCCRKMRRILLNMKEIETHLIEKQQYRVSVCGRFVPADVAIKIRKKMKRRVEILEIQELSNVDTGFVDQMPRVLPQPALLYN
ncbi:heavy metal-associated isoprenylated plant protein 19 [Henckelia pumila]|uniref:heavy metal-associated isoprenylated plant protein 19 n=1 Tax=Henckelia pumila TaxID=405737 RepID=UPI003C6E1CA7